MSEKQQRLVLSIIDFLNQSISDGTVKSDDKESLEVAIQCLGEAFGVDPSDETQVEALSIKPTTLQSIFDVFLKTKDKVAPSTFTSAWSSRKAPTAEDKAQAEKEKVSGNAFMSAKKYDEAIAAYSRAVALDVTNPIYYSNRAAASSSKGDHLAAVGDAEKAIEVDPSFVKAYHRLGHAQYSLADYRAAADAFGRGLKLDPSNTGLKSGLENSKARIPADDSDDDENPPPLIPDDGSSPATRGSGAGSPGPEGLPGNLAGMADMLRGMGGGEGGGGMPDISAMLNNPQLMAMAQQMAQNGGLANLMSNPAVTNMMNRVQSGNMPSMDEIMADPALRSLASQFGGMGGGR